MGEASRPTTYSMRGATLSSSSNVTAKTDGYGGMLVYVTAVSSTPVCTVEALLNGGTTWEKINCWQRDQATLTKTARAANTSITLVARDVLYIPCEGYQQVRLLYSSGTSATVDVILCSDITGDIVDQLGLTISSMIPGTGATALGKAEDAAHTSGDVGVMALGVRQNTAAALGGTDGDYMPLILDALGRLWTAPPAYATVSCGELAGSATAVQMPTVAGPLIVKFKAAYDNVGRVYIGNSGATVKNGTTDTTTGFELSAGEETPWFPVTNVNVFYRICDNAGDDLTYIALSG